MKSFLAFVILSMLSFAAQAQEMKRKLPTRPPDFTCVSADGAWRLLVNIHMGMIRVVEIKNNMPSHRIVGLKNEVSGSVIRLFNTSRPDLPVGLVFEADLKRRGLNAIADRHISGTQTRFACRR